MKKKHGISIKMVILIPVFALGIVSIFSNIQAISNIRKVNTNASQIADECMKSIAKLGEIQSETRVVHSRGLSHIIATDLDTMIAMVDSIREEQDTLERYLDEYEQYYLEDSDSEELKKKEEEDL